MNDQLEEQLKFARSQRFEALQNALKTIDVFAEPSLSPDKFEKYEEVKNDLFKNYGHTDEQ
jgi:hypothetical protein